MLYQFIIRPVKRRQSLVLVLMVLQECLTISNRDLQVISAKTDDNRQNHQAIRKQDAIFWRIVWVIFEAVRPNPQQWRPNSFQVVIQTMEILRTIYIQFNHNLKFTF